MNFNEVVEERINKIRQVLVKKEEEYAKGNDRFHNFNVAARTLNCSPERALLGMMMKHVVSVLDIIETIDDLSQPPLQIYLIDEKIGDNINYLILLEGMLLKRLKPKFTKAKLCSSELCPDKTSCQYFVPSSKSSEYGSNSYLGMPDGCTIDD